MPPVDDRVLTEGLGAFDAVELLGSGTFGTTFRVARGDDGYAIKVIHADGLPPHLWDREIRALQDAEHPNVVAFRTAGVFEARGRDYSYLECEFIDGGSVGDNLRQDDAPTSGDELREFLTGLLAGVAEIHDLGIIHRDIKPANIALRSGDWGSPVLLDFRLAKVLARILQESLAVGVWVRGGPVSGCRAGRRLGGSGGSGVSRRFAVVVA